MRNGGHVTWYGADKLNSLLAAFKARQIHKPTAGKNMYLPIVALVAGRYDDTLPRVSSGDFKGQRKWVRDLTMNKYAGALRYFAENGIAPADVVKTIKAYPGKLNGIVEADRETHGKPRNAATPADIKKAKALSPLGSVAIAKPTGFGKAEFGQAFGVWEAGEFRVLGFVEKSESAALRLAVKAAKAGGNATLSAEDREAEEFKKLFLASNPIAAKAAELHIV